MKNNFSYENNQQCHFQVNYNYYPQQPHDPYDYQQQIVTPTSAPDLSMLTIRQLNDLYPRSSFLEYDQQSYHEQQPYFVCPLQPLSVPFGSQQQQHAPSQQVAAINGPSYKEVMLLMDGLREKLDTINERLRVDQRCKDIEQKWYGYDKVLYDMMEDASNNNFVELLCTVNTTLQCHPRFAKIPEFRALCQEIEDMLLKLAIRYEQMSKDLSQLMKDKAMEATLETLMKTIVEQRDEIIMLRSMNQRMEQLSTDVNEYMIQMLDQPTQESHHTDISTDRYNDAHSNMYTDRHINFAKDVADEDIQDSHTYISTDGYVVDAQYEYKFLSVNDDMSTNNIFHEQSCENNTMEEPSEVEEPTIFEDVTEASTIATNLVNDEAADSTTSRANFCSQDEITRITNDPINHPNAPDDAEIKKRRKVVARGKEVRFKFF
ncbi:hypothetical protein DEO72_LG3g1369 [Vigna unguiculata]|uniref:Uncharacterized protein n=1 Tax=Vigna unguiculata TaxID=3917 RepID=A0A4D6LE07_VIGUN|nr:hypothetical protein DEO72_LG3g1369 [Vigna unguiculata]